MSPEDVPYRLKDILPIAYPNGGMTLSGLRREIAKGNLVAELTAGRHFVTLRAIEDMRKKCRVAVKGHASGTGRRGSTGAGRAPVNGSSSTAPDRLPQDTLRARIERQRQSLRATSKTSGAQPAASAR